MLANISGANMVVGQQLVLNSPTTTTGTAAQQYASNNNRPLTVKLNNTEIVVPVPTPLWPVAESVRDKLSSKYANNDQTETEETTLTLTSKFLQAALDYASANEFSTDAAVFVNTVFLYFHETFLTHNDVHAVTREIADAGLRQSVIRTYFLALFALERQNLISLKGHGNKTATSALLAAVEAGRASLFVVFGGQGNVEEYFDELVSVYTTYESLAYNFVQMAAITLHGHSTSEEAIKAHATRIDVVTWLEKPDSRPSTEKLLNTDLSLPLIGLTQLLSYWVMLKVLGLTPGEMREFVSGTTGHSQGIVSSVVIASSETEKQFLENTQKALGLLFWIGLRSQQSWPTTTVNPNILQDSLSNNEGFPTPMLLVTGIRHSEVKVHADATNTHLPEHHRIHLSLINGPRACIFTGPPQSLYGLNVALRKLKATSNQDQSRIPHSQRKVRFTSRFLPVTVPFHSAYLKDVPAQLALDVKVNNLTFDSAKLGTPVYHTNTGADLRGVSDLTAVLVEQICIMPVRWEIATKASATHVLDFGPGRASGVGGLTHRNKEGTGVQVILASTLDANLPTELLDKSYIFDKEVNSVRFAPNWAEKFRPRLIRVASTNEIHVETSFSRLLGKPPLMVAGMTPCTSNEQFVSAVINAGFHVELAGGGQHTEQYLRQRVNKILDLVGPGEGITLNILFLNPRLWGFQYPAVMAMRREGVPMDGICIAAGVPSLDVADDVVKNLKAAGIKHVAFKPGSVETIRRVITIAKNHPDMPVILQWTGGRGGGHHSFEDFHGPMLETYAAIRRVENIILVVGSGFGDDKETLPYLTGDWSVQFDYAPMPFDGLLFGSRVMVAKENLASPAVKQLIVDAPGITDESQWERTYKGVVGGVITVKSELGEPIHKIANKGVLFWREMDDEIFSLPKEKRMAALMKKKEYIIRKLNSDFQKPWFGKKADGRTCDLHEMTYKEVAERLLELLYVAGEQRWIDDTHRDTAADFLVRIEERFSTTPAPSMIQGSETLEVDPESFFAAFFENFPDAAVQTLTQEDVFHFLSICSIPWRKPVTFIPVLDEKFEFWLKKDSLWQSEDVNAVVGQDAGRVAILQGPVAVRHSAIVDEPVKDILGNIYKGHIEALREKYYGGSDIAIPVVEYLGEAAGSRNRVLPGVTNYELNDPDGTTLMYELTRGPDLPPVSQYLEMIGGFEPSWLRALLTSEAVVRGKLLVDNPIIRIMRPRPGQSVFVKLDARKKPQVLSVYSGRSTGSVPSKNAALVMSIQGDQITVTLNEKTKSGFVPLNFYFKYRPFQGYNPIHEVCEGRNQRIKDFYASLWNVKLDPSAMSPEDTFRSTFVVERSHVKDFVHSIGNQAELYNDINARAPMDYGIAAAWRSVIAAILPKEIDGDLLCLVHLSNQFRMLSDDMIMPGDVVDSEAVINAVIISESGKTVEVKAVISKAGKPVLEIISCFLYRGKFADYDQTFKRVQEAPFEITLKSAKDIAVLKSKKWVIWNHDAPELTPGSVLVFRLDTFARFKSASTYKQLKTTGTVELQTTREIVKIATVDYTGTDCAGNIVIEYLQRFGSPIEQDIYFSNGGYSILPDSKVFPSIIVSPESNEGYAQASGDLNPIHVNPYFADLASLPGTITHGMWTSAAVRKFVEIFAANNQPQLVKEYHVSFKGMVLPGDQLETKLNHVGMSNGKKLIKITTTNQRGEKVLDGSAEVEQPTTAYVFTGQGSQEVGMGMDLYAKSAVAKALWDRADSHMIATYGVSILDIVRNNPNTKTVYFGGLKGAAIRNHYRNMTYDVIENGKLKSLPLFPDITDTTPSYTFSHPSGLLSATQFTQPALTLMEMASFSDMKANGLVQEGCTFAGHSLGEYAGLASVGQVLSVESLVDVVFYRGMTMQVAVPRDAAGRSDYGMCAVSPIRVSATFGEQALQFVVKAISDRSKNLIEIVNFNVANFQYVVAGDLLSLEALRLTLNKIKALNINFVELIKTKSVEEIEQTLGEIVHESLASAQAKKAAGIIVPERGAATIPLAGIDVPFHSSFLMNGVTPFREILRKKLQARFLNVSLLVNKYIPNLTATPYSLAKEYFVEVYELTKSAWMKQILEEWDDVSASTPTGQQQLGYALLIELLAHQFASPVRWIETQDYLFKVKDVERLIEVGPSPVLVGMAVRTLKMKYEVHDDAVTRRRVQLCTSKDHKDLYYEFESMETEPAPAEAASPALAPQPVAAAGPAAPVAAAPVSFAAGPIADEAPTAMEILHVLIAHKLKKSLADIPLGKSIKDLVGGKSTLQNEILGDLAAEFGNVLADKAEENPLSEVGGALQNSFSGSFGKTSTGLVNKLISAKMPAGFAMGAVKAYLSSLYGLGPKRSDSTLLHGLTMEPPSRFVSEGDAKAWLDTVAKSYASKTGISLGGGSSGGSSAASAATVTINSEEFNLQKLKTDTLIRYQLEQFAKYLDIDLLEGAKQAASEKQERATAQAALDQWVAEHGDEYADGIRPAFTRLKVRVFDSYWNWARQDALDLYYSIIFGHITSVDRDLMNQCVHLMNRTDDPESLIAYMEYYIYSCPADKGENYARVQTLGKVLLEQCKEALNAAPVYRNLAYRPKKPKTYVTNSGKIVYTEENRSATNMKDYVKELEKGSSTTRVQKSQVMEVASKFGQLQALVKANPDLAESAEIKAIFADIKKIVDVEENVPFVFLKSRSPADPAHWEYDKSLTSMYLDALKNMAAEGISFQGKHALVTGCGKGSIGVEVLKALLSGGACVVVTTSRFSKAATEFYRSIYESHGSKGSRLVVAPFNGGSMQDVKQLVDYIYGKTGLGWDLDYIIPFASIPEQGRELDGIDSRSELAHRIMLTNLLRLLGEVKIMKQQLGYNTRPAAVLLPLSPNHGTFGGDGLYGESKIALETLLNRFHAESWSNYLTIIGAAIGWTRGTGLMSANNTVAEGIESLNVLTFSTHEMAFTLVGLLHPEIVKLGYVEPIFADLNGGLSNVKDLNTFTSKKRKELMETSEIRRAVAHEAELDEKVFRGPTMPKAVTTVTPRANMKFGFPSLPKTQKLTHLRGVLDLEKIVVVTGFGEVGPWGSSRTRWEIEAFGEFSLEGCVEMAWMMGFIKFHNGPLKKIPVYSGWIDAETQEPVKDLEIKAKYEQRILEHTGIRLIEPSLFNGYDPNNKMFLQEVAVTHDLAPLEVSKEEAEAFRKFHGANAVIEQRGDTLFVHLKKGSILYVPKALRFDRLVAGQIPTGWSAARYGIPDDIISQVDPITLYTLVATVEALITSGVTDPYEFYQYVHVSEVGNTSGGGMGGMRAMQRIFRERMMEKPVQMDILQESFINTMPAWINMLLLSSSGPIKTPVGACATAAESVDIAYETIMSGKARIVLCGGYDDFQEEGSYEFANMKATSNSIEEFAKGREPRDMCRPATDTRAGFMEAQGAGIHVVMTADLAIKMGVPIRGIIACTNTATDKNGRSVPAPGQGILTTAREVKSSSKFGAPMMKLEYRMKQLKREREHIKSWISKEYEALADEVEEMKQSGQVVEETDIEAFVTERTELIQWEGRRKEKVALAAYSHDWWKNDPTISPIKGSLAMFGLTVDDIGVASFHGTGTKANDYNESSALNQQLSHMGRTKGNVVPCVFQKHLTGHPKGAAAAWMLNGVLQVLETGIVPGNRNLDNVEDRLRKFKYLLYPSHSIRTDGVKAGLLKSFGFGQAGGEVLVIHPDYLYAALEEAEYSSYFERREARQTAAYRYYHEALTNVKPFVRVKSAAPYTEVQQSEVYLNPLARAQYDSTSGTWAFPSSSSGAVVKSGAAKSAIGGSKVDVDVSNALLSATQDIAALAAAGAGDHLGVGVGVDVQLMSEVNISNEAFILRNFTPAEVSYCQSTADPQASFAGRWAAKEAVIKAVSSMAQSKGLDGPVWTRGAGAPLVDIEVQRENGQAPVVVFHKDAKDIVEQAGLQGVKVTISHSGSYAVAVALAH